MRIAVFDNLFDGGAKRVVFEQIKHLSKKHSVGYFSNLRRSYFEFDRYCETAVLADLELYSHQGIFRILQDISLLTHVNGEYKTMAEIINRDYDLVLVHPSHIEQGPLILNKLTIPSYYYAHEWLRIVYEPELFLMDDIPESKRWYERLMRMYLQSLDWTSVRSATHVIANSSYTASLISAAYRRSSTVIHPGVDELFFRPASASQRKHFLFVGAKEAVNGYDLLKAALDLTDLPYEVTYVSPTNDGLYYTDAELLEFYQKSVAVLCLSKNEPFGMTAVEAMACGTPVIALNQGGYQETVVDGETGILIDEKPELLLEAMKRMAVRGDEREALGSSGRERVLEKFTWKRHMNQLSEVLEL